MTEELSGAEKFAAFGDAFGEVFKFSPVFVGAVIVLIAGVLLAMALGARRRENKAVRAFVGYLKRWPQVTNADLYAMISHAHTIRQEHLQAYGVSRTVLRHYGEFHQRYHDAIVHPFIYERERVMRAMAFILPDMPVHLAEGEEEKAARVERKVADELYLKPVDWELHPKQKIRLKFLGKGRLIRFKAIVVDPAANKLRLYAYRSESQRHYLRIRVPSAALFITVDGQQRELPVIDLSAKSFLCRMEPPVPDGTYAAELRLPAAPRYTGFTVQKVKQHGPDQAVFMITRIGQALQEDLIQYIFDYQHNT